MLCLGYCNVLLHLKCILCLNSSFKKVLFMFHVTMLALQLVNTETLDNIQHMYPSLLHTHLHTLTHIVHFNSQKHTHTTFTYSHKPLLTRFLHTQVLKLLMLQRHLNQLYLIISAQFNDPYYNLLTLNVKLSKSHIISFFTSGLLLYSLQYE